MLRVEGSKLCAEFIQVRALSFAVGKKKEKKKRKTSSPTRRNCIATGLIPWLKYEHQTLDQEFGTGLKAYEPIMANCGSGPFSYTPAVEPEKQEETEGKMYSVYCEASVW